MYNGELVVTTVEEQAIDPKDKLHCVFKNCVIRDDCYNSMPTSAHTWLSHFFHRTIVYYRVYSFLRYV